MNEPLKIQTLKKFKYTSLYPNTQSYEYEARGGSSYYRPSKIKVIEYALEKVKKTYEEDKLIHQENLPLIEINKQIREKIESVFKEVGIPSSRKETDTKSRKKYPPMITVESGYVDDIRRYCPISDGWDFTVEKWYINTIDRFEKELAAESGKELIAKKAAEEEALKKKKERLENKKFFEILIRYNLPDDYEWEDVYDSLREKDKYLDLGLSLLDNREDWTGGYDYAEGGINRFEVETEQDQEIVNDIVSHFGGGWDNDGRCFRDTKWSYGKLFTLVEDSQLYEDCMLAREKSNRYL